MWCNRCQASNEIINHLHIDRLAQVGLSYSQARNFVFSRLSQGTISVENADMVLSRLNENGSCTYNCMEPGCGISRLRLLKSYFLVTHIRNFLNSTEHNRY